MEFDCRIAIREWLITGCSCLTLETVDKAFCFFLTSSFTCLRPRPAWHCSHHQTRVCGIVACDGAGGGDGVDGDGDHGGGGPGGRSLKGNGIYSQLFSDSNIIENNNNNSIIINNNEYI